MKPGDEPHNPPTLSPEDSSPPVRKVGTLDDLLALAEKTPGRFRLMAFGRGDRVTWERPDIRASPAEASPGRPEQAAAVETATAPTVTPRQLELRFEPERRGGAERRRARTSATGAAPRPGPSCSTPPSPTGRPSVPDASPLRAPPSGARSVGTLDNVLTRCERTGERPKLLWIRRGGRVTWQRPDSPPPSAPAAAPIQNATEEGRSVGSLDDFLKTAKPDEWELTRIRRGGRVTWERPQEVSPSLSPALPPTESKKP